ncbi:hypothetical protein BD769DRAFT_808818 [Suillus cothurnatus]|nr:hypothetical protein BD769DRAFT_808818 [Suillus cothurnatus]
MESRLLSVVSGFSPLESIAQLVSAVVVIFEHSFYIFDKRRYLQNQQESAPSFYVALDHYMSSSHAAAVREAVSIAAQEYEAAVTTAAHAYEVAMTTVTHTSEEAVRTLPTWRAKLPFERFKKKVFERSKEKEKEAFERSKAKEKEALCSQAVAELIKTILETTLNHRLPRP